MTIADTILAMADKPNGFDELLIIAKDEPHLSKFDRETITRCAYELQDYQRQLIVVYQNLIETKGELQASRDRIKHLVTQPLAFPKISMQIWLRGYNAQSDIH